MLLGVYGHPFLDKSPSYLACLMKCDTARLGRLFMNLTHGSAVKRYKESGNWSHSPSQYSHTETRKQVKNKETKRDPCVLYPFEMIAFLRTITQIH